MIYGNGSFPQTTKHRDNNNNQNNNNNNNKELWNKIVYDKIYE